MKIIEYIHGAEQLVNVFGCWPSFHDAEVLWMRFDRRPDAEDDYGVQLEAVIHAFEITNEISSDGYYVLRNHVQVHLRFSDVVEIRMDGFNHQNALDGLYLTDLRNRQWERIFFEVQFASAFGVSAFFQCHAIEVVSVTTCSASGKLLNS